MPIKHRKLNKNINLTKKFNKLKFLKETCVKKGHKFGLFICDCGNFKETRISSVTSGTTKSCGCITKQLRVKNLENKKFGKITLIKDTGKSNKKHRSIWEASCDCGKKFEIEASYVKNGNRITCGCSQIATYESALDHHYNRYKRSAKIRGISFNLSKKQFKKLITKPCYYCKAEPVKRTVKAVSYDIVMNGIDRVNNDRGYYLNNVVSCCKRCNYIKSDMDQTEFITHIQKIADRNCGNDYNTRTTYVTEANVGDTSKILLLCIYDLSEKFNMQKSEILSLFSDVLNEHIIEIDESTEKN